MSSRAGNWIIIAGALGMVIGLACIPAAVHDPTALSLGASLFSMGALMLSTGIYLKAKALSASTPESAPARRIRGGCEICQSGVPVITCKVHNLHLCADCLGEHYDFRSCAYVPTTRRQAPKPAKAAAKAFGR